ncbi:MAG: hypothetical protein R6T90_09130, partial [Dissulfuribacterales bacterium]
MKLKEKLFNRYSLMIYFLFVIIVVLIFRLATLTIAQGDYYRDLSDNKRVKEVYTTAPRGEIRDRHGRLLAGNVPTFTVQLLKDELNIGDREERNHNLLELVRLLEADGAEYTDDYPIEINYFKYNSMEAYLVNVNSPMDKVVNLIIDYNLMGEYLTMEYDKPYEEHFEVSIFSRAQDALGKKKPVVYSLDGTLPEDREQLLGILNQDKLSIRKII